MSDLISREALLKEIRSGKGRPHIYDGMQEADWIMRCIREAPVVFDLVRFSNTLVALIQSTYRLSVRGDFCSGIENVAYHDVLRLIGICSGTNPDGDGRENG